MLVVVAAVLVLVPRLLNHLPLLLPPNCSTQVESSLPIYFPNLPHGINSQLYLPVKVASVGEFFSATSD